MNAEVISEILDRGKDDWVDFAEVMAVVRSRTGLAEPEVMAMSVEVIDELLNQHRIMVGDLSKQGDKVLFSPREGPANRVVERIQRDLASLGHRPGIGDICWLSTT